MISVENILIKSLHEKVNVKEHITVVRLENLSKANAFGSEMIDKLTSGFRQISLDQDCALVVVCARGKHFSAGADLEWMRQGRMLDESSNKAESSKLKDLFESLDKLLIPKIAVAHGSTYGGGNGLLACCDFVLALEGSQFCLSEAKLGLIPAVISPYLARRMNRTKLRYGALTSTPWSAEEALLSGLIDQISSKGEIEDLLHLHIDRFLNVSFVAQKAINELWRELDKNKNLQGEYTVDAISKARQTSDATEALDAFLNKSPSPFGRALGNVKILDF